LAEVLGAVGQTQKASQAIDEALLLLADDADQYYEAELYRLKGELLLEQY